MTAAPELPGQHVADLVLAAAQRAGEHTALVDADQDAVEHTALTWAQVRDASYTQAAALLAAGLAAGDRVAVRAPVGPGYCVAVFAVLLAGGVLVPMNIDLPPRVVADLVRDSGAGLLVGDPVDGVDLPTLPASVEIDPAAPAVEPVGGLEDLAVLCYTSGTSGRSRGVQLSHRALLANVAQCAALRPAPVTAADRVLLALPLSHAYGLGPGLLQVAAAGATGVLLAKFGVQAALSAIERYRVTTIVGVPPMYSALIAAPEPELHAALSSVRLLTSGAAPLSVDTLAAVRRVTGLSVYEGYGLTETGPVLTSTLVGGLAKPGSVGRPLPGVQLRLVDSDGAELPGPSDPDDLDDVDLIGDESGGTGLVAARGPNLFSGYWPDGRHGPDAEGWFRTGDIGYLDADGDLHLVDRAGDLIIVNGFNVYPHEVEAVLDQLDGVREAAAVGAPAERTGETVRAVLVVDPAAELTEQRVIEFCAARLAPFKVPSSVEFVESLPHTVTGKLARSLLH
jgi:long-chain acyl-CoA synthetase